MPEPRLTAEDKPEIQRLLDSGETRASIARIYGMAASQVTRYCQRHGIAPAGFRVAEADRPTMPADLDVRTLDSCPGLLFGRDGIVYSDSTDPPRARSPKVETSRQQLRLIHRGKQINVTRLACEAWHGPPPEGAVAIRINGDPEDIRPENLEWRQRGPHVSGREFVEAWQTSISVAEVADRLGISPSAAMSRAEHLRENGVPLRELVVPRDGYDDLAELARELARENDLAGHDD